MKSLRTCLTLLLTVTLLLSLTSCGWFQKQGKLRGEATQLLDALIADDADAFYKKIKNACTEEEFLQVYPKFRSFVEGVSTYELKLNYTSAKIESGVTIRHEEYFVETEAGRFGLIIATRSDVEGISTFRLLNQDGETPSTNISAG